MKLFLNCLFFTSTFILALCQQSICQKGLTKAEAQQQATVVLTDAMAAQKKLAIKEGNGKTIPAVMQNGYKMRFDYVAFGEKPADGRSLYISLHGGGQTSSEVNDQQWQNQHYLYAPVEGIYLVPRAPTNTWNLWHEAHIDDMLEKIIKNAIVMEDVNPNKIYILGYSAGGDGVFQLGTRMADHWAAAAMMAGHPGDASVLNLRNLPFSLFVGGLDSAYNRNKLVADWAKMLDSLHQKDTGGYIHDAHIYPNLPHWMNRNDTAAIPWLAGFTRKPLPNKVVWIQDDRHHETFYWLGADSATIRTGDSAIVSINNNDINIEQNTNKTLYIYLNDKMMDLDKKVKVLQNGKTIFSGHLKRNLQTIKETAEKKLDKDLVFYTRICISNGKVNNVLL